MYPGHPWIAFKQKNLFQVCQTSHLDQGWQGYFITIRTYSDLEGSQ